MQIFINKYHKDNVLEKYLNKMFEVYSRSGLNEMEKRLINILPELKEPKKILILENRTSVLGIIAKALYLNADITMQSTDQYYCDKLVHNITHNHANIEVRCEADISGEYDYIFWQQSRANMMKEYVFDLMQQAHTALKNKGKIFLAMEAKEKTVTEKMQNLFGGATISGLDEKGLVLIAKKKNKPVEYTDYSDTFSFKTPAGDDIELFSLAGVFAHHRVDEGAKALMDKMRISSGDTLMDMGCGIGSIGISLAKAHDLKHVYFVDSNARAVNATKINCQKNGVGSYDVILSASGYKAPGKIDVFAGNPPYFSDYRIAELFVVTAHENLIKEGIAWFVTKNPWKLADIIKKHFGNCQEVRHHGYSILTAKR